MANIVTRFAPSPTGLFHAGSYRTALFAYIFARQNQGKFILRIEDTDKERSRKEYEENILDSLKWMGLDYDEFYRQSERTEIYKKYLEKLMAAGQAYLSKETLKEAGDRTEVIRFRNPNQKVVFQDLIRGQVEFDTTELGDFVIAKSLEEPVFHLVNVVDDHEMGVTHIVRGEDHISNTPRQILIFRAIGATPPQYAHIPLLLAADRSKLSKRHGALAVTEYRERGYLPEALVNYMALLGWHPTDDREILTMEEILRDFSLARVQKSGAIFDEEKLKWFNREYINGLSDESFQAHASAFVPEWIATSSPIFKRCLPLLREKISALTEISSLFAKEGELGFVHALKDYQAEALLWKKNPNKEVTTTHLRKIEDLVASVPDKTFTAEALRNAIWNYAENHGKGDVLWPFRMALTGQDKSPDPFVSAHIIGRTESLNRINIALKKISQKNETAS